jgi:hypothetical protein
MMYRDTNGKNIFKGNADSATSATKATQDGNGKIIASTYLTKDGASSTYLTKSNATSTYLTKTDAGNTYLKLSGGTISGNLTVDGTLRSDLKG